MDTQIIIMAAGKGTRMKSTKPKVLQELAGKPLLAWVLDTAQYLSSSPPIVVYGFGGDQVRAYFAKRDIIWAEQSAQLGTGHAVLMALPHLPKTGQSLILSGDVPLISPDTLNQLITQSQNGIGMVTLSVDDPFGLGRIVRKDEKVVGIVEQKDASPEQQQIREINSGIYCVCNALLHEFLPKLNNQNNQNEYYLTDIIQMAVAQNIPITTVSPTDDFEIQGVNDKIQLAQLERTYQQHLITKLQKNGVHFADPARVDIRGSLRCGTDVFIDANCVFIGDVVIGDYSYIGSGNIITDSQIGSHCHIKPYCVLSQSQLGDGVHVGPFAHLRPQSQISHEAKIGNFVEIKKSTIGTGSKISHLSYIGDSALGQDVNIGAGVITCNYDGVNKFTTTIQDGAFVGSNVSLVAPVCIGTNATIAAGSVITKDAPDDQLTVGRARQTTIAHWQRPKPKTNNGNL